ncbi:MAG: peptide-binding protein [Nitrospirales bacterium]|nr:MAG: peptide-binding protein [Nitrospirales bacterium]
MIKEVNNNAKAGSKIFRNFGCLTVGKVLADISTFLFFLVLARNYGQEGIGQYSFAMALTGVLVVFADFGLQNLSIKDMSRDRDQVAIYYGRLMAVRLLLSVAVCSALVLITLFLPLSDEMKLLIIVIGAYQIIITLVNGFGAVFVALESMHVTSFLEVSLRVTTATIGIAIVGWGGSLLLAISSLPVMTILHVALGYYLTHRRCGALQVSVTLAYVRQVLSDAFPYALHALFELFSSRVALIFIGFMLSAGAAGIFNVAYRFVFVLLFIPVFAKLAIFPVASRLYVSSPEQLKELYGNTLNLAIVFGLPMAAGIWLIAPKLIEVLYGLEFVESIVILRWLAWLIPVVFLRCIMEMFLIASDRQPVVTMSHLWVACMGGILHYFFIGMFGLEGAAVATLLAEISLIVLLGIRLKTLFVWQSIGVRIGISSTAVAAFLFPLVFWNGLSLPVTILFAVFIYFGVLALFNDIRKNELRLLLGCLSPSRQIQSFSSQKPIAKSGQI